MQTESNNKQELGRLLARICSTLRRKIALVNSKKPFAVVGADLSLKRYYTATNVTKLVKANSSIQTD